MPPVRVKLPYSNACFWAVACLWTIPLSSPPSRVPCSPYACLVRPSNSWIWSVALSLFCATTLRKKLTTEACSNRPWPMGPSPPQPSLKRVQGDPHHSEGCRLRKESIQSVGSPPYPDDIVESACIAFVFNSEYCVRLFLLSDLLFRFMNFFPFRRAEIHPRHC